jgi:hypothetical protein
VGVICSKRKKSTILMAQILHLFYIYWKLATTHNNTAARKHGRNICATRCGCFDVYECSFVQDVVEFNAKIEVSMSSPIGTDDMIFLARLSSYTLKEPNTFIQGVIIRSCCTVSVLKRMCFCSFLMVAVDGGWRSVLIPMYRYDVAPDLTRLLMPFQSHDGRKCPYAEAYIDTSK